MAERELRRDLGLADLVFFNVTVVFSLRGIATAAKLGPLAITLWIVAALLFFVPLAWTVTELATRDPGEGGFYRWVKQAFGERHGFLASWFYWLSNLTYLPYLLVFLIGNVAYLAGSSALGEDRWFVLVLSLSFLWALTWLNVRGWSLGRWLTKAGELASWSAALLLAGAGAVALARYGSATPWSLARLAELADARTLGYFGTLSLSFAGLELAPLMGGEIRDPARAIPRAILLASVAIVVLYVIGTLAILVAVPPDEVSPIAGVLDAVQAVSLRAGWPLLPELVALLVALATLAGFSAWLGGMARLPYAIGLDRFLPAALAELHPRHRTPHRSILVQSGLTSLFLVLSQAGGGVRQAYLVLVGATTILTFLPFLYLFLALPRLRPAGPEPAVVRVPFGRAGPWTVALAGCAATLATLASAVIPAPDAGDPWAFEAKLWGGLLLFGVLGLLLFRRAR
jgi:amino acid transporter